MVTDQNTNMTDELRLSVEDAGSAKSSAAAMKVATEGVPIAGMLALLGASS